MTHFADLSYVKISQNEPQPQCLHSEKSQAFDSLCGSLHKTDRQSWYPVAVIQNLSIVCQLLIVGISKRSIVVLQLIVLQSKDVWMWQRLLWLRMVFSGELL